MTDDVVVVGVETVGSFLERTANDPRESVTKHPNLIGEVASNVSFLFTPIAVIPLSLRIDAKPIDKLNVLVALAFFNKVDGLK